MKKSLLTIMLFAALPLFLKAQSQPENDQPCCSKVQTPVVKKGYYSIGNNAQKLNTYTVCCNSSNVAKTKKKAVTKGYYAIGNNNEKLPQTDSFVSTNATTRKVSKGYYAIGNNNEKLAPVQNLLSCCACDCK